MYVRFVPFFFFFARNIVSNEYLKFLGKNPKSGDEQDKRNEKFVRGKGNEDFGNY